MADTMPTISKIQLPGAGGQPGNIYEIKDAVARAAAAKGLTIVVVSTLPTASAETMGAIYLVPSEDQTKEKNIKDEFITYQPTSSTYAWEKIGTTDIDLSDYAKYGDGVTVTLNSLPVSGTAVSAHSITDNKHGHTVSGTTTADGTNEASAVSFAASTISASKLKSNGSVTAGTATTPAVIDTSKFSGGTPTSVTLPTFSQGTDNFTANTPTVINTTKFSGGSLSAGSFNGGSGSFTQGAFSQGTLPEFTTTVTNETLTLGWSAGTLPTHGEDVHVHNVATHTQGTLTPAAFQEGFYTAGSPASFTQGEDSWTTGSVSAGSPANLGIGFYTAGITGTPTTVTLPTFDAVNNLVNTSNAATAAAQKFTGKASNVTGTAADAATGISIANHTVTQGTVSGSASGTINTPAE